MRPASLPTAALADLVPMGEPVPQSGDASWPSPYEVVVASSQVTPQQRTKGELLGLSRQAEMRPLTGGSCDLVLVTLQHARNWTPATRAVYDQVALRGATVLVYGAGLVTNLRAPARREVGTVSLNEGDPVNDEWTVLFCSGGARWGFVARQVTPTITPVTGRLDREQRRADTDRVFEMVQVQDEDCVDAAAEALLARVSTLGVQIPSSLR